MGSETKIDYVTENECSLVVEDQVHDAPEKSCRTVQKPVTKYRQEQECNTRYEQECNTRYEQSCHTVVEKECSYINGHQKCWDEPTGMNLERNVSRFPSRIATRFPSKIAVLSLFLTQNTRTLKSV